MKTVKLQIGVSGCVQVFIDYLQLNFTKHEKDF